MLIFTCATEFLTKAVSSCGLDISSGFGAEPEAFEVALPWATLFVLIGDEGFEGVGVVAPLDANLRGVAFVGGMR
jgi:hypothetical protein